MHALVLTVNLAAAAIGVAPELHLAPELALANAAEVVSSADVPSAPRSLQAGADSPPPRRGFRGREWAAASALTLAGDAFFGYGLYYTSVVHAEDTLKSAEAVVYIGAVLVFLPPALAIWGARLAGAPAERSGDAYLIASFWRILGGSAAYLLRFSPPLAIATLAVTDVVVMTHAVVTTLGDVPVSDAAPPPPPAVPVRDPALVR
ncbi:MAG TPA: hypothetical protein VM753_19135 [Anaeromyxobacter sp.]|jgi:hypothetical protein|nr:hypothetical protein [Anaeromyxobacter sp.]